MGYTLSAHDPQPNTTIPSSWGDEVNANFVALAGFFRHMLPVQNGEVVTGIDAAALVKVESTTTDTIKPHFYQLDFSPTTDEGRVWSFYVPPGFISSTNTALVGLYSMSTTDGGNVILNAYVMCISDGDVMTAANYDAVNTLTEAAPAVVDEADLFTLYLDSRDSMEAGDLCSIVLARDADNGSDTAGGVFQLHALAFSYSLST
jgi:hypothetical protein